MLTLETTFVANDRACLYNAASSSITACKLRVAINVLRQGNAKNKNIYISKKQHIM